jgi:hypothetical protein
VNETPTTTRKTDTCRAGYDAMMMHDDDVVVIASNTKAR